MEVEDIVHVELELPSMGSETTLEDKEVAEEFVLV